MSSFDENFASVLRDSNIKLENLTRKYNGLVKENNRLKKRNEYLEENAEILHTQGKNYILDSIKKFLKK